MTPQAAKRIVSTWLAERGMTHRLSAHTIGFEDLARMRMIFVTVHGWQPDPQWDDLRTLAIANGFRVESDR